MNECAWWPAERVEELESKLFEADRHGRVTGWHIHGTFSVPNPTVTTLWLLERAEEEGGEDAKLAMLIRALWHYRCAYGFEPRLSDEVWLKAYEALRCVHPVMRELDWSPGSKNVLPTNMRWQQPPGDLTGLAQLLGDDGADLLRNWVPVRIQDASVLERKSEPA